YRAADLEGQLRSIILTSISSFLAKSDVAFIDMAANQMEFSAKLKEAVSPEFARLGLELTSFFVQSLSLPEQLQGHLDRLSSMGMFKDLQKYARFQTADSISVAAANPGGAAGAGAGLGAGIAMGQTMMQSLGNGGVGGSQEDPIQMIEKLNELLKKGILTQQEFDAKKAELLSRIQ
ncbi:MAG TPA: SPFH domain-containing protein, partial [Micavibrio sp.]